MGAVDSSQMKTGTGGNLGTFAGVFTPSVLTILGIILFLRLGYVVGQAGLARTLIIIGLANAISVLTSVSLSAIATNLRVKGGGDYYLISRTLGVEFGGAIGVVLFLAQSVSIAFYCIGFGEALTFMFPEAPDEMVRIVAAVAVCLLFILAWKGADWATRFQYVVMGCLAVALVSFLIGGLLGWETPKLAENWAAPESGPGFWLIFAIFFPAVTGFTQGVSMSGDLKDPGRSLPMGTFLAVGVSILVYFGAALLLAGNLPLADLSGDYRSMNRVAWLGFLIDVGVIAATLSSAMASFLGAPRILQSLAKDRVIPILNPLAKGSGPMDNPRRAVLLSLGIALVTVALGRLNVIAPVVSMFFLISYGLLNYATYFEARAASPSFRPRFKWYDKRLSLLGFLACLGVMLAINPAAGLAAVAILMGIYQYLQRTAGPRRWADSRRSYHMQKVREHLLAVAAEPEHHRDWRPRIVALTSDPSRAKGLLRLADWLEGGAGLTSAVRLLTDRSGARPDQRQAAEEELAQTIKDSGGQAFPLVVRTADPDQGLPVLLQSLGLGPLKANTLLVNLSREERPAGLGALHQLRAGQGLKTAFGLGLNLIILGLDEPGWPELESEPVIDVWWRGDPGSKLGLLLAHLVSRHDSFSEARIRLLAKDGSTDDPIELESLKRVLEDARIEAEPILVEEFTPAAMAAHSAEATISFIPGGLTNARPVGPGGLDLRRFAEALPRMVAVLAAEEIDLDAEPEEGAVGDLAQARDAVQEAQAELEKAQTGVAEAQARVDEELALIEEAEEPLNGPALTERVRQVMAARDALEEANQARAKALVEYDSAARRLEEMGGEVEEGAG